MDKFCSLSEKLKKACPGMEMLEREEMSRHTSFRIGGAVRLMVFPRSAGEIAECLRSAKEESIETLYIGNGTNVLAPDEGLDKLVIMTAAMDGIAVSGDTVTAMAGALLSRTATRAKDASLTGMEFAHGIPGSVGGAVCMNGGAYGGEMKDIVAEVEYVNAEGEICRICGEELGFSYRHSFFTDNPDCCVTKVELKLQKGDAADIKAKMDELSAKRRASQPLDMPSAGSTFKRPKTGYAAALIDQSGLKGLRIGGAMVSPKHAGFIVNAGGATAQDVKELMKKVAEKVFEDSGVRLEPEVKIL